MMISFTKITFVELFSLALLLGIPVVAQATPPTKPGNPGVPGLLAEIEALGTELAVTKSDLAMTEAELASTVTDLVSTQGALSLTQTSLAVTQADLQLANTDLNVTNAFLDETLDALEREQNRYRVPQTGQGHCWGAPSEDPDDPHSTVPCSFTGQDGQYDAGLAPPFNRFVDNGDGTVTDRFTELVWLKNADCINDHSWQEAVAFGKNLFGTANICGLQDQSSQGTWRLPNVRELMSLLDFRSAGYIGGEALPDGHPFTGFHGIYWTSTTYALPSSFDVTGPVYPCVTRQYGLDNRPRFNEAYIVNVNTSELIHTPKEDRDTISRRHDTDTRVGGCSTNGFRDGSPGDLFEPKVIAVRNLIE